MDQSTNYTHKIDFLINNNVPLSQPTQTVVKSKYKKKKCNECNKRRKPLDESHQICHVCYRLKTIFKPKQSGNKTIDDFIRNTQVNLVIKEGKMEFVPYNQFKDVEFIAEGGFSKIYKTIWIGARKNRQHVVPKNSIILKYHSKELNEVRTILYTNLIILR